MSGTESESEDGSHKGDEEPREDEEYDREDEMTPTESPYVPNFEGEMGEVSMTCLTFQMEVLYACFLCVYICECACDYVYVCTCVLSWVFFGGGVACMHFIYMYVFVHVCLS